MQQAHSDYLIYLQKAVDLELASNEFTEEKQECWINAGQELEIEGVDKKEISKRLQEAIERKVFEKTGDKVKINNGHWYRIMKRYNWTVYQPKFDETITPERLTDTTYIPKETEEKEKPTIAPVVENTELIRMLERTIVAHRKLINYAKTNPITSLVPADVHEDILTRNNAIADNLRDFINRKQNIPTHAQSICLLLHFSSLGIHDLISKFYCKLKETLMIEMKNRMETPLHKKEMRKFLLREIITLDHTLEFPDAATARLYGFYGQQCKVCKGYRTKVHPEKSAFIYCIKCGPTSGIEKRRTLKKCEKCESDVDPGTIAKATVKRCAACK